MPSPGQLLIILVVVLILFGTKRLRSLGGDLGSAIKGFQKAMKEENTDKVEDKSEDNAQARVIEGEAEKVESKKED